MLYIVRESSEILSNSLLVRKPDCFPLCRKSIEENSNFSCNTSANVSNIFDCKDK